MMKSICTLLGSLVLVACASTGLDDSEKLALYQAHAGEPVPSMRLFGRLDGWTPLGDSAIALWTRPREAWLLELSGCPDLPYAQSIVVTSTMNRVQSRFDRVRPLGGQAMEIDCQIQRIRPLDISAIRDAERDLRDGAEVEDQPRGEESSPGSGT